MAIIKFNTPKDQFNKSVAGQTFYSGTKTATMRNKARMRNNRSVKQMLMNAFLISSSQYYRDLSPEDQANWNTFAAMLPQQTMRNEFKFLTGYAIFVKRNQHLKLFRPGHVDFMKNPSLTEIFIDIPVINIYINSARLIFSAVYPRGNSNLDCLIGLSGLISPGISFLGSGSRLVLSTKNVTKDIDITNQYFEVYKTIPTIDQIIQCSIIEIGTLNGQYFFMPAIKIIVTPVLPPIFIPKWGFYYNTFNPNSFAPPGWRLPTITESYALFSDTMSCWSLIYPSTDFWLDPSSATNSKKFNAIGAGERESVSGSFIYKFYKYCWANTGFVPGSVWIFNMPAGSVTGFDNPAVGVSVRFIKDSPGFVEFVTGNNGITYQCVEINNITWMAEDSRETLFQDLTEIPLVNDNAEWTTLTYQAYCTNP